MAFLRDSIFLQNAIGFSGSHQKRSVFELKVLLFDGDKNIFENGGNRKPILGATIEKMYDSFHFIVIIWFVHNARNVPALSSLSIEIAHLLSVSVWKIFHGPIHYYQNLLIRKEVQGRDGRVIIDNADHPWNTTMGLDLTSKHMAANWKAYKQQWENYAIVFHDQMETQTEEYRMAFFLYSIGTEAIKTYNSFDMTDETHRNLSEIMKEFDKYAIGETNETYERYIFNRRDQKEEENIDRYVAELRTLAQSCGFCKCLNDSLIRDRIVRYKDVFEGDWGTLEGEQHLTIDHTVPPNIVPSRRVPFARPKLKAELESLTDLGALKPVDE
ncbi:hypothetical protein QZH41_007558 [Actinostola sp. cb2023]|nr:hypothetical protein QZH41_007558 [Actinostola sp. cb2023]